VQGGEQEPVRPDEEGGATGVGGGSVTTGVGGGDAGESGRGEVGWGGTTAVGGVTGAGLGAGVAGGAGAAKGVD
jgi:hypothetical protein